MDNQHKMIKGYRDLTATEIDYMNQVKEIGEALKDLLYDIEQIEGIDQRAVEIARTELQTGCMWLTRAIARPNSF